MTSERLTPQWLLSIAALVAAIGLLILALNIRQPRFTLSEKGLLLDRRSGEVISVFNGDVIYPVPVADPAAEEAKLPEYSFEPPAADPAVEQAERERLKRVVDEELRSWIEKQKLEKQGQQPPTTEPQP